MNPVSLNHAQIVIGAQIPIVCILIFLSLHAYNSLKIRFFFFIYLAWVFNLIQIIINFLLFFYPASSFIGIVFQVGDILTDFITSFLFLTAAYLNNETEKPIYPGRLNQIQFGLLLGLYFLFVCFVQFNSGAFIDTDSAKPLWGTLELNIPAALSGIIGFAALFKLSQLFRKKSGELESTCLWIGTLGYAFLQVLAFFRFPENSEAEANRKFLGYFFSMAFKMIILYGLHRLLVKDAQKKAEVEKINLQLDQILGETFHEITAPLRTIQGRLNELSNGNPQEDIRMTKKARRKVETIEENYNLVIAVVSANMKIYENKMRKTFDPDLFPVPRGEQNDRISSNNLNTLIEIAIISLKDTLNTKDRIVFYREYGKNCDIPCYPSEVIRVIYNVMKNSYDAFSDSNGSIFIRTRRFEETNSEGKTVQYVRAEFADNGPGIPADLLDTGKIFTQGFSTKGNLRGHGMYLVKGMMEHNKGLVLVQSPYEFNQFNRKFTSGTLVTLIFPSLGKI